MWVKIWWGDFVDFWKRYVLVFIMVFMEICILIWILLEILLRNEKIIVVNKKECVVMGYGDCVSIG